MNAQHEPHPPWSLTGERESVHMADSGRADRSAEALRRKIKLFHSICMLAGNSKLEGSSAPLGGQDWNWRAGLVDVGVAVEGGHVLVT